MKRLTYCFPYRVLELYVHYDGNIILILIGLFTIEIELLLLYTAGKRTYMAPILVFITNMTMRQ